MSHTLIIYLCGMHSLAFAVFHMAFRRLFRWKTSLDAAGRVNKGIIRITNCRLIYLFLFTAFICFCFPQDLLATRLGHAFLAGGSLFWLGRAIEQFIFLRINHQLMHLLTALFIAGAILFCLPLM